MITSCSSLRCESVGWPEMVSNFLKASEKRLEMSPGSILCMKKLLRWRGGVAATVGDTIYLAIKKSVSCWK